MVWLDIEKYKGVVIVNVGPMGSGKSAETIKEAEALANHTDINVHVARHLKDSKGDLDSKEGPSIGSRTGLSLKATIAENAEHLLRNVLLADAKYGFQRIVTVDEIHFYDERLPDVFSKLTDQGRTVLSSGLERDAKGRAFPTIARILGASNVEKREHAGYCQAESNGRICLARSTNSFKLYRKAGSDFKFYFKGKPVIEGWEPAPAWSPTIDPQKHNNPEDVPEGEPFYIAVCPEHFQVPDLATTFEIEKVIRDSRGRGWSPGELSHPRLGQILQYLTEDRGIRKVNKRYFAD